MSDHLESVDPAVATAIDDVLDAPEDETVLARASDTVAHLCQEYPIYGGMGLPPASLGDPPRSERPATRERVAIPNAATAIRPTRPTRPTRTTRPARTT